MTGKTHQVIGLTAGLAAYLVLTPAQYEPATLGAVVFGSHIMALLPDIDQPGASLWRMLPFGRVVGVLTNPLLQHRNLSHSLLGLGLVGWGALTVLRLAPEYWGIAILPTWIAWMVAYASHIVADMLTVQGVPLLFPVQNMMGFPPQPFEELRVLTGRWFENLIIFPLVNLILIATIVYFWPQLTVILYR